jgi:hypothetical protein
VIRRDAANSLLTGGQFFRGSRNRTQTVLAGIPTRVNRITGCTARLLGIDRSLEAAAETGRQVDRVRTHPQRGFGLLLKGRLSNR